MVKIIVNGKEVEVENGKRKLMDVLRNDCHLKSVKDGCSEGACGTCTVIVDGKTTKTCVQTVDRFEGKSIVTVEGLNEYEKKVYTYAFATAGAVQCGFCTPGMVMCAKALLDVDLRPDRVKIAAAIRGNLCRCTGYKKIIDAIELAASIMRGETELGAMNTDAHIGQNYRRVDAEEKVLGTGQYVDDVEIDGMVHASAVRTKYPRAKILSIDTSKAEALEGVLACITVDQMPARTKVGHIKKDWDVLRGVGDITRYIGDAIVLVVAETEEILEEAKKLVEIEYEELVPITKAKDAIAPDAPLIHEDGNICNEEHMNRGNVEEAIKNAAFVVTEHFETPVQEHAYLEPEAAIAMPFGEDGYFIYSSDQGAHSIREECAYMMDLPEEKIVVENKLVGGGFGGREDALAQPLALLAAAITKRVVKVKFSRKESLMVHPKRHAFSIDITLACDKDGKLVAMKEYNLADTGAYASLAGPVLQRACIHASGPYNFHNIQIDGVSAYTNNPPAGAYRGFGVLQTCFAIETCLNMLAKKVGISEWEIRYRNAVRPGDELPNGQIADASTGIVETLLAVKDVFENNKYVGIGCAIKNAGVGVGLLDYGRCVVRVKDGKAHIHSGATGIGQGLSTVFVQMLCESSGLSDEYIVYHLPNTAESPDSGTTSGSRQTTVTGEAVKRAGEKLREALKDHTLEELEGTEYFGEYFAKTDKMGTPVPHPVSHVAYSYATQVCVLNEDGTVQKIVAAHEIGRAVNPKMVEGQIEGGVVMSLGYALTEKYVTENGYVKTTLGNYGLFRADKVPPIESIIIEKEGVDKAYGAIGMGEIVSIPTAPAISAAYAKLDGQIRYSLPLQNTAYSR
jgi:selenium-dependent xanthine dehydrogenase